MKSTPLAVLLSLSLLFFARSASGQFHLPAPVAVQTSPRTISTSGESTVYVAPDEVVVNLGVETFAQKLDEAKSLNDQASARLIRAIKELGVEGKHLQTAELEVQLRYRGGEPIQGIEGYYARRDYAVTLKDVKKFEKLIDAALTSGANRLHGFQYRSTELRKHRDDARKMAIRAAKEKAELLAGELGCKVGPPRSVSEDTPTYFGHWSSRASYGNSFMTQNSMQVAPGGADSGESLPLGQIAIRATVHVVFDLLPRPDGH